MVTLYSKPKDGKRFKKVKTFRRYDAAWGYVADALMRLDPSLNYGYGLQHLHSGYSRRRVWPFASHEIVRSGHHYRIAI